MARSAACSLLFPLPHRKLAGCSPPLPDSGKGAGGSAVPLLCLALCLLTALPLAAHAASLQTPDAGRIAAVSSSQSYCVRNGTLWGWGKNFFPDQADSSTPQPLLAGVRAVKAELLLKDDGSVWGWGLNTAGQLGMRPAKQNRYDYFPLTRILDGVRRIDSAGATHFALKRDGTLWGWGENTRGLLGNGSRKDSHVPVRILKKVRLFAVNDAHALAVLEDGTLMGWGVNHCGQIGDGTRKDRYRPVKVDTTALQGKEIIALGLEWSRSMAVTSDGTLWRWGFADDQGSFPGDKYFAEYSCSEQGGDRTPRKTSIIDGLQDIVLTPTVVFGLKKDGTLWAWGRSSFGLLGAGQNTLSAETPIQILAQVATVTAARYTKTGMALREDGSLWTWGHNGKGQLGDGSAETRYTPVPVGFEKNLTTP